MPSIPKSKVNFAAALIMTFVIISGCGVQDNDEAISSKRIMSDPIVIKFTFWGSGEEKKVIENTCSKFSLMHPEIKVEAIQIPETDYDVKMTAMVASNDSPDYAYFHGQQGEIFANQGKFINWFEMLKKDKELKKEDFMDGVWFQLSPDNAWAISASIECFGLFYNKDLFKAAGIPEPPSKYSEAWTWNQFLDVAKKLTLDKNGRNASEPGFDPQNIMQFGVSFENWYGPVLVHILNNGGDIILKDGKTFGYSRPEATKAIQRLADLINVYHVAPSPIQAKAIPGQAQALQSRMVAMSMHGQWINLDLGVAGVHYGIAALPKMDRDSGTMIISGADTVFKSSQHFNEAWMFSKFMCGEGAEDLYIKGLWMPIMKKYYQDPALMSKWMGLNPAHPEGFKDAMVDMAINHSKPCMIYYLKNQSTIDAMINAALDPVWMGKKTADQAMKELQPLIQPQIQGRYDIN